jgi:Spy/CpxP family protein refolding chaperone
MGKENMMTLKSTLLVALGALFIAAPAAVQAQPGDSDSGYYHHHHHYYYRHDHGCGFYRRGEYGLFGHYQQRLTFGCR